MFIPIDQQQMQSRMAVQEVLSSYYEAKQHCTNYGAEVKALHLLAPVEQGAMCLTGLRSALDALHQGRQTGGGGLGGSQPPLNFGWGG